MEIVGAGPGDPELISLRGKRLLEKADLILYAGSLVPVELTYYAKPGATVRSSASMTLEEQFALMKDFYDRGMLIVRLHTGTLVFMGLSRADGFFLTVTACVIGLRPGFLLFWQRQRLCARSLRFRKRCRPSFLPVARDALQCRRREKLHLLARSQSTMCIFLSASIVEEVQRSCWNATRRRLPWRHVTT